MLMRLFNMLAPPAIMLLAASPFIILLWVYLGRPIWNALEDTPQQLLIGALAIALVVGLYYRSLYDCGSRTITQNTSDLIDKVVVSENLWGTPLHSNITYEDGMTANGPVTPEGDRHGKWQIYTPPEGQLNAYTRTEWYYHGKKCTKTEFYRWRD